MAEEYSGMMGSTLSKGLTGMSSQELGKDKGYKSAAEVQTIIDELSIAEADYKDELEYLAVVLCEKMFPFTKDAGYQINAKLVTTQDVNASLAEADQGMAPFTHKEKRRVSNAFVQGAAVKAMEEFQFEDLYHDYMSKLPQGLREKYAAITRKVFKVYHDPITIPIMLQTAYANIAPGAGSSKITPVGGDIKEDKAGKKTFIIDAMGVCFPILIHEIVKGINSALARHGLSGGSKEANQAIIEAVDTLVNEIDDIRYGKFIHNAVLAPYDNSNYKQDARLREVLLKKIYQLELSDFSNYVRTALAVYIVEVYNKATNKNNKQIQDAYNELMDPTVKAKWQADWKKWTAWAEDILSRGERYYKKKDAGI